MVLITTIFFGPFIPHLLQKNKDESSKDLYQGLIEEDNNSETQKKIKYSILLVLNGDDKTKVIFFSNSSIVLSFLYVKRLI